jgi:5-methylcytosine-specific restriction protein B
LSQLSAETGHPETELARWIQAIERKGQAILYGPPGTGKTFLAERLARHLTAESDGFTELVQFHPAYAYEDFIQGIRPETGSDGRLTYPMKPGRFLDFCQRAANRDGRCVLIIDEINRANLSRVFGELMYLLEYRNERIPLAGGYSLKIHNNVRLIGTMNTADRSIALVDHALRRRFAFIRLAPNYDILRRYHQNTGFPIERLIPILTRLNNHINDPHYEIGHTFFLHRNLSAELPDIWQMEIEPYLEEYFFDRPQAIETFRWDNIRKELEG